MNTDKNVSTVHEQLAKYLPSLLISNSVDTSFVNKFMRHSGIFFDIIIKSMAQYLLASGRIKVKLLFLALVKIVKRNGLFIEYSFQMHRYERFSKEYQEQIELLVQVILPYIVNRHKETPVEISMLNKSFAEFLKVKYLFQEYFDKLYILICVLSVTALSLVYGPRFRI